MTPQPIHRWYRGAALKALALGVILESVVMAPVALSPWGHAGPESVSGVIGLLLNLPGFYVMLLAEDFMPKDSSFAAYLGIVYIVQVVIISCLIFVFLRWRGTR